MTIKQQLQSLERALVHRVRTGESQALMARFVTEGARGRVLCRDGISRPQLQWMDIHPEVKHQLYEMMYPPILEGVKRDGTIDVESKKLIKPYLRMLDLRYRKAIAEADSPEMKSLYIGLRQDLKLIRAAKIVKGDQGA